MNNSQLKRFFTYIMATMIGLAMLSGCGKKEPIDLPFPDPPPPPGKVAKGPAPDPLQLGADGKYHITTPRVSGAEVATPPLRRVEHGVRKYTRKLQYGMAWVILVGLIALPGPLLIFAIPGLLTGRLEKILEGILIFMSGIFVGGLVQDAGVLSLVPWVYGCLLVPGALLFLWGIFTSNEAGKFILVVGPALVFGLFVVSQMFRMLVMGIIGSAVFTFLILVFVVVSLAGAASRSGEPQTA